MRFNTFASSIADIEAAARAMNVGEVLIEPTDLAREGTLSLVQADALASAAQAKGLRPVLVWDALMPQRLMDRTAPMLANHDLSSYAAVRVADPGVAFWLLSEKPNLPIQFLAETGSHNLEALRGWGEILAPSLERFILSIELPEEKLIEYCRTLTVDCEVLGAGRILLFYSPRSLLASHLGSPQNNGTSIPTAAEETDPEPSNGQTNAPLHLDAVVRPQKSLNRAFPTVETVHGTFMYLDKDQFILDRLDQLREAGLHMLRLDLRHLSHAGNSADGIEEICSHFFKASSSLRESWPYPTRSPFFKTNRTTAQFSRMKSPLHEQRDETCLAEIIAGDSGNYVVYQAMRDFQVAQVESIVLSTGEEVPVPASTVFHDRTGQPIQQCVADQIVVTGWLKKAVPGSLLKGRI